MMNDYLQLQAEWEEIHKNDFDHLLRHKYSKETAQLRMLAGLSMRQLDYFTAREAYSFPACPHVHKCRIMANYSIGSELRVDLAVLVELFQGTFADLPNHPRRLQMLKKLQRQLQQLVCGLEYLSRRHGCFRVTKHHLSYNAYGWARVWLSQDITRNQPEEPLSSEQQMVQGIVQILQDCLQLRFGDRTIGTFYDLLASIQGGQYQRRWESNKKVTFGTDEKISDHSRRQNSLFHVKSAAKIGSRASIDNKTVSGSSKHRPTSSIGFQFDKSKKSRWENSKKEENSKNESSFNSRKQKRYCTLEDQLGEVEEAIIVKVHRPQEQKENEAPPERKESKTLTHKMGAQNTLKQHSRRYSNAIFEQVQLNPIFSTQEHFCTKRRQSLLRVELEEDLEGLFNSSKALSFDSLELEKELEEVL